MLFEGECIRVRRILPL